MKTTVALLFAMVILLPHSANATTLTILGGGGVLNSGVGPGGEGSLIRFAGDDFSVYLGEGPGSFNLSRAFGVEPFVLPIRFYTADRRLAEVQVGTQICHGVFDDCGDITLISPGFAMPADWPTNTPFVATVPFTAIGELLVGGNQYDMVGHGTVTGTRCLTPCAFLDLACNPYLPLLSWRAAVARIDARVHHCNRDCVPRP